MTLHTRPTTIAEADEMLERVRQARRECCGTERALICDLDDKIVELIACRVALIPEPRKP